MPCALRAKEGNRCALKSTTAVSEGMNRAPVRRRALAKVILRRAGGGVFEIFVDDRITYSKKATGRFPTDTEIVGALSR